MHKISYDELNLTMHDPQNQTTRLHNISQATSGMELFLTLLYTTYSVMGNKMSPWLSSSSIKVMVQMQFNVHATIMYMYCTVNTGLRVLFSVYT